MALKRDYGPYASVELEYDVVFGTRFYGSFWAGVQERVGGQSCFTRQGFHYSVEPSLEGQKHFQTICKAVFTSRTCIKYIELQIPT